MVIIKSKFSRVFQTLRHEMHSNLKYKVSSAPRPKTIKNHKTYSIPNHETHSTPSYKTSSIPNHKHLMYQTDTRAKLGSTENGMRGWEDLMKNMVLTAFQVLSWTESDEGEDYKYEHNYETLN